MSALLALFLIACGAEEEVAPPELAVQPWSLEFGEVTTGLPQTATFEVINGGGSELVIDALTLASDDGGEPPFSVSPSSLTLGPGERSEVSVTFTPRGEGEASWSLGVESNLEDISWLSLRGWGVAPRVEVSPREYSCPLDGEEHVDFLTVTNHGPGELAFDVALEEDGAAFWMDEVLTDARLAGGEERVIRFGCQADTYSEGAFTITTNDPDNSSVSVPLYAETIRLEGAITSHTDGEVVDEGETTLTAEVWATDHHDPDFPFENMSLTWHSVLSGRIGAGFLGEDGTTSLEGAVLEPGFDTITFIARSNGGDEVIAVIDLIVDDAPRFLTLDPADGQWWPDNTPIELQAIVADANDAMSTLEVRWVSSLDGDLGAASPDADGVAGLSATLSRGEHTLTTTATNARGLSGSAEVQVTVLDCGDTADSDGDGYSVADGDCDDEDPEVNPGADQILGEDNTCTSTSIIEVFGEALKNAPSVDATGDLNGDGLADVLIGSPYQSSDSTDQNSGAAYLLMGGSPAGFYTLDALPTINNPSSHATMGYAVSILPDQNGDGLSEVALGAPNEDRGVVYIFHGREAWGALDSDDADFIIEGSSTDSVSQLGIALDGGDFDGDGYGDLAVGAAAQDQPYSNGGGAYVFLGAGVFSGAVDQTAADIRINSAESSGYLGSSLAVGDFDGDGRAELALGAPFVDSDGMRDVGMVAVLSGLSAGAGSVEISDADVIVHGPQENAEIGTINNLASAGDVTGDGFEDLLVRAFHETRAGPAAPVETGRVYLLPSAEGFLDYDDLEEDAWSWKSTGDINDAGAVAGAGDLDGDGYGEILIGREGYSESKPVGVISGATVSGAIGAGYSASASFLTTASSSVSAGRALGGGDTNGDGRSDLVVNAATTIAGSIYLYESGPTCVNP